MSQSHGGHKWGQMFKAVTDQTLEYIHSRYLGTYKQALGDQFYISALEARQSGTDHFKIKTVVSMEQAKVTTGRPTGIGLGAIRLRPTSAPQPFTASGTPDFTMPFAKPASDLEDNWMYLLRLEDAMRAENSEEISDLLRVIVHLMQIDPELDVDRMVDGSKLRNFQFLMNDSKGQEFVARFIDLLDSEFLRLFFFTMFVVFPYVEIGSTTPIAVNLFGRLVNYLSDPDVSINWLMAFVRQACPDGTLLPLVGSTFKLGCLAAVLTQIRNGMHTLSPNTSGAVRQLMTPLAENLTRDLGKFLHRNPSPVFMRAVVGALLHIVPGSPLSAALCKTVT